MAHKKLDVWKKSMDLVETIYKITANYPKEERYGLTGQMRRCAVSIASNIAEGAARRSDKENLYFISIALGSVAELETQFLLSNRLNYVQEIEPVLSSITDVKKLLLGYRNYIQTKVT
jgi:four helix bundle protein